MSKVLWMIEHERVGEDFCSGEIDEEEASARLKALGFDTGEINDQISALKEEMGDG